MLCDMIIIPKRKCTEQRRHPVHLRKVLALFLASVNEVTKGGVRVARTPVSQQTYSVLFLCVILRIIVTVDKVAQGPGHAGRIIRFQGGGEVFHR